MILNRLFLPQLRLVWLFSQRFGGIGGNLQELDALAKLRLFQESCRIQKFNTEIVVIQRTKIICCSSTIQLYHTTKSHKKTKIATILPQSKPILP
jgi:hypothetical protein